MKLGLIPDSVRYRTMSAQQLRDSYLFDSLCADGEVRLAYIDTDRAVIGMVSPGASPLPLPCPPELRAESFLERREIGVLNIGGAGTIAVDGQTFRLENLDCLYIGRGASEVAFASADQDHPSIFYLLSYPAHTRFPATLIRKSDASPMEVGSAANANRRVIYKYIHQQGAISCQLVMGVTHLKDGSVWNTMPPHTHMRRSEIYMYFNFPDADRVFHFMGCPEETRHILVSNRGIVVSPGWSIHAGVATHAYSFCWGMGGENQDYSDMDAVAVNEIL